MEATLPAEVISLSLSLPPYLFLYLSLSLSLSLTGIYLPINLSVSHTRANIQDRYKLNCMHTCSHSNIQSIRCEHCKLKY